MVAVKIVNIHNRLALLISFLSLLGLMAMMFLTSPLNNVGYVLYFFGLLFILLVSAGYALALGSSKPVLKNQSYKIFIISTFLVILAMFKSAGSLGFANVAIIILLIAGMLFYFNRRA